MFDIAFLHRYRPVGSVAADRCRYLERAWQLGINHDFACLVEVVGEVALTDTVGNDIVGDVLGCLLRFIKFRFACSSENVGVISAICKMVVDMIYNHCCFLLPNNLNDLADKFFGVVAEQSKL